MRKFDIDTLDTNILEGLKHKINNKTKPLGALGFLEEIALKVGTIQQTLTPKLTKPTIVVFAADHGIAADGVVNPFPQEVTWQMVYNFLNGGAAINVFAKQHAIDVKVVDAGVNHDFMNQTSLIHSKVGYGTKNYLYEPAMTKEELTTCIDKGAEIVTKISSEGTNSIGFGEMGIGNTSAASLLMSKLLELPITDCVGKGTGLDSEGVLKKKEILKQAIEKHENVTAVDEILQTFGGFEIAMMVGAMLRAAELKMILLIDGFIVSAALLVAFKINPQILDYCIFGHTSQEQGHQKILEAFQANPLLSLGMRLGEGTGAALAFPLVQSSVNFLNEMASFEDAQVSSK